MDYRVRMSLIESQTPWRCLQSPSFWASAGDAALSPGPRLLQLRGDVTSTRLTGPCDNGFRHHDAAGEVKEYGAAWNHMRPLLENPV